MIFVTLARDGFWITACILHVAQPRNDEPTVRDRIELRQEITVADGAAALNSRVQAT